MARIVSSQAGNQEEIEVYHPDRLLWFFRMPKTTMMLMMTIMNVRLKLTDHSKHGGRSFLRLHQVVSPTFGTEEIGRDPSVL